MIHRLRTSSILSSSRIHLAKPSCKWSNIPGITTNESEEYNEKHLHPHLKTARDPAREVLTEPQIPNDLSICIPQYELERSTDEELKYKRLIGSRDTFKFDNTIFQDVRLSMSKVIFNIS